MKERGGQLFALVSSWEIAVTEVTGLRRNDRRTLVTFELDAAAAQAEISDRFQRGLHFVGEWHSHPQGHAKPSKIDELAAADLVRAHGALGFVLLVIVGRDTTWVGLRSKDSLLTLEPLTVRRRRV